MPSALVEFLQALGASPIAAFLRDSAIAYASLNAAHIFSIAIVVGSIVAVDLRALGLYQSVPFAALAQPLTRLAGFGVAMAIVTGFLLFSVRPLAYAQNPAFLCKVGLVGLGIVNALALRADRYWAFALEGEPIADSIRAAAFRSLLIWAGAVLAGRWIGFLQ